MIYGIIMHRMSSKQYAQRQCVYRSLNPCSRDYVDMNNKIKFNVCVWWLCLSPISMQQRELLTPHIYCFKLLNSLSQIALNYCLNFMRYICLGTDVWYIHKESHLHLSSTISMFNINEQQYNMQYTSYEHAHVWYRHCMYN